MSDAKRQEIKDRVEAAQARNAGRDQEATLTERVSAKAVEAKDGFTDFARKHPVALVAGGLAAGVLISALFKGSPTRRAGRAAGAKAAGLAALGSEIAMSFARDMMDSTAHARQAGADRLEDIGDAFGDRARSIQRETAYRMGGASDAARSTKRNVGKTIARTFRRN